MTARSNSNEETSPRKCESIVFAEACYKRRFLLSTDQNDPSLDLMKQIGNWSSEFGHISINLSMNNI